MPEHLAVPAPAVAAPEPRATTAATAAAPPAGDKLDDLERTTISRVLEESRFNKSAAAKRLGLSRGQLYQRLRKYQLGG